MGEALDEEGAVWEFEDEDARELVEVELPAAAGRVEDAVELEVLLVEVEEVVEVLELWPDELEVESDTGSEVPAGVAVVGKVCRLVCTAIVPSIVVVSRAIDSTEV